MQPDQDIHLALAADEAYFPGLAAASVTAICSLPRGERQRLCLWVIDGGLSEHSWSVLERLVSACGFGAKLTRVSFLHDAIPEGARLLNKSSLTYARILLPEILPVDRVIYLDCDILVFRDLRELWSTSMNDALIAAVSDPKIPTIGSDLPQQVLADAGIDPQLPYFNAGIFLADLKLWRVRQIQSRTLDLLKSYPPACFRYWDQSILNVTLAGRVSYVGQSWNHLSQDMPLLPSFGPNAIIHFASEAPFTRKKPYPVHRLYRDILRCMSVSWNTSLVAYRKIELIFLFRKIMPSIHKLRAAFAPSRASDYAGKVSYWKERNSELDEARDRQSEQTRVVDSLVQYIRNELAAGGIDRVTQ